MITHKCWSYCLQSLLPARILMTRFILSYCAAAFKMRVSISCGQYPDEVITNFVKEMYILKHCSLNTVRTINRNLPCRTGGHKWYPLLKWLLWGSKQSAVWNLSFFSRQVSVVKLKIWRSKEPIRYPCSSLYEAWGARHELHEPFFGVSNIVNSASFPYHPILTASQYPTTGGSSFFLSDILKI